MRSIGEQCLSPLFMFYIGSVPICLTFLLFFLIEWWWSKELAEDTREGMPLFIIFEGELHSPDGIYLSAEQEILLKINGGLTSAPLTMLLLVYFVCNIQYPKECMNVYMFLERYVNIYESVKLAANQSYSFEWTKQFGRMICLSMCIPNSVIKDVTIF